jgi:CHAD domain-containing protein
VAKPRPIELDEQLAFGEAAARAVEVRAGELGEHAGGVLDTEEIERVHDLRVATRRLRAALEVFARCFPSKRQEAALGEVKELADALGERRDRDVAIDALEGFAKRLAEPDQPGITSLTARLREEQQGANRALAEWVRPQTIEALTLSLRELAQAARERVREQTA